MAFTGRGEQVVNNFLPAFRSIRDPVLIAPFLLNLFFISLGFVVLGFVLFGTFKFLGDKIRQVVGGKEIPIQVKSSVGTQQKTS